MVTGYTKPFAQDRIKSKIHTHSYFLEESLSLLEDSLTQLAKFKGGEFACILARC